MEKKYYDLIVTLIKKHRKYPGLESLLDDIAQDAYNHAQVVLGTITNEDVINSYLNKVISTSIITVPKRMNFNTRAHHRVILPPIKEIEVPVENEIHIDIPEPEHDINLDEELEKLVKVPEPKEESTDKAFTIEETDSTPIDKEPALNCLDEVVENNEHEISENSVNKLEETIDDLEVSEHVAPEVDKTLVDKMINGNSRVDNTETENIDTASDHLEDLVADEQQEGESIDISEVDELTLENKQPEETSDDLENLVSDEHQEGESIDISEVDELTLENEQPEETSDDLENLVNDEQQEGESIDISEVDELTLENEQPEETSDDLEDLVADELAEIPESNETLTLEESVTDEAQDGIQESFSDAPASLEENNAEIENESELEPLDNSMITDNTEENLGDSELDELLETSELSDLDEFSYTDSFKDEAEENIDFTPPSYDCFSFTPSIKLNIDVNEITEQLSTLEEKQPELHITEVYNLKYRDGKSIDEISAELDMTQDAVLEALSEIIYVIKD